MWNESYEAIPSFHTHFHSEYLEGLISTSSSALMRDILTCLTPAFRSASFQSFHSCFLARQLPSYIVLMSCSFFFLATQDSCSWFCFHLLTIIFFFLFFFGGGVGELYEVLFWYFYFGIFPKLLHCCYTRAAALWLSPTALLLVQGLEVCQPLSLWSQSCVKCSPSPANEGEPSKPTWDDAVKRVTCKRCL